MNEPGGLRTLKKERTRQAIADAAIGLFLANGFDQVSVAEIAAAAEVSKPTLFRYFASKEELVLHRIADHRGEAGRVVRERPADVLALEALQRHYLDRLAERDAATGLCPAPEVLAFHRLVFETPSLSSHLLDYIAADTDALAEALAETVDGADDLTSRLLAAQFLAVRQTLARANWARLAAGQPLPEAARLAVADALTAFTLLRDGASGCGY
ncbi:TetR family transcriptional regulator [Kitasatospora sp. GP82]|uniref:TetR family transcriptional regulator n=1 Tax=Kitasatospora sp. GP82 TaxID=3035089 RepID=UPI00247494C6|nr:TetR family transcriptional regulator [Kitasatospora sp. GP82]MDH6127045.1 AcrR family transcriptional regulator [Kitasatospora sp. GP82]